MFSTILVPVDGSPMSERALPVATRLAQQPGARLVLVRAAPEVKDAYLEASAMEPALRATHLAREQATAELATLTDRLRSEGLSVDGRVWYEEAAEAILDAAREGPADLIVMSTHGRSGLGRWVYGSVADRVVRCADVPVLLIPAAGEPAWPGDHPVRVAVSLDGSSLAEAALAPASALADALDAELLLLRCVELQNYAYVDAYPYVQFDLEAELADARGYLEAIGGDLRARGKEVALHVQTGNPALMIGALAAEQGAAAIVMATHGRGGLARLVMGSVATGTIQRSTVPLLLVRPAAVRESQAAPAAAPEPPPAQPGPSVSVSLTQRELDLLERGLGELLYTPGRDWRLAEPIRGLLTRLREARPGTAARSDA